MYELVGIQLHLKLSEIHVLHPFYPSLEETLWAILDLWRKNGSPLCTWKTIIDVLKEVGEGCLSTKVDSLIET